MKATTAAIAVAIVTGAGAPTFGGVSAPSAGRTHFRVVRVLRRSQPGACLQSEALRRRRTTRAQAERGLPALEFARLRKRRAPDRPLPVGPGFGDERVSHWVSPHDRFGLVVGAQTDEC